MATSIKGAILPLAVVSGLLIAPLPTPVSAQSAHRDGIADLLARVATAPTAGNQDSAPNAAEAGQAERRAKIAAVAAKDPRAGDPAYEQARRLMAAVDAILKDTAEQRTEARKLPSNNEFIVAPLWTETREDREAKIRTLLDATLAIITDQPIVEMQQRIEELRREIRETEDQNVEFKEKQLTAPKDGMLPGMLTDTISSLQSNIDAGKARIEEAHAEIADTKTKIHEALKASGIELEDDQVGLLLDSVLSGDLVRLVAAFHAAKLIDAQLGKLMTASSDNMKASRKYFAMHAALFAILVHAQSTTIEKIDTQYLPRLDAILKDIKAAKMKTRRLLKADNRLDQKRALEANRDSQKLAEQAAKGYKRYLRQQREQIANARQRAAHDLNIADNTFETVEASFQLRRLMRDSATSFEAIQKLEAPTFDQIFNNEELRREFENLTRKLDIPTS